MTALPAFLFAPLFGGDAQGDTASHDRSVRQAHNGDERLFDDKACWAQIRAGDESAFAVLFDSYWMALCRFAERFVHSADAARDIVQDVMIRVWDTSETADIPISVRAYLYAAVRNRALHYTEHDRVVQQTQAFFTTLGASPAMGASEASAEEHIARRELAAALDRAITTLSPRVRQVALLKWGDALSRTEIAHILGVSPFTVDKQLGVATRAMRAALDAFLAQGE